ncbi:LysR family transcriptional regulator [Mesorhizobium sp. M2D.F.Ca.ET.185.01.1.1]|uniref:LysR family transcriptional regulator n=1 Tax=unclassified Mesorhizobium TaxID=325217 RepID=UPI000FC9A669|nr:MULTISPECIES: LysR family transcriptional regulator [unclassified Mesorhizobium]TGP73785.1 LysR family transcriptional regulator [bacterium M00.F.Ca.ET.227.01.1.1]TGP85675.1 LysR family transcriptional regulator [bacterium M00.F.Ca.ET.221.01.1.1]TGP90902.1 LysR family transcriptional regulator [bacterium M00.F.Ca.ET.222.01.1.1]TGT68712.1 LysR family transcriptional regulator [bacterium M00.F.Ca.ET.159.01.1.1]TGT80562.1 LysR family transcriptional regulator [bacterium M00.F.Ca.ET.157.01.1.1]
MPLRFTLRQLEYFVAVGEAGSIAKAAEQVNVSPPSISASIAQLEAEFGVQLFVRKHSHALALTAGGRLFLKEAARLLNDADALHDIAGDIAEKVRGPLAVGCLLTFAQIVLPALRRKFEDAYPDVRVRQFERNQGQLFEMLQRGEIDAALTYDLELSQDMTFEPLVQLPAYVMLPAAHRLAGRAGITPEELVDEPMVLLDLPYSREYFLSAFQGLRPRIAERTGDIAVMRSMVANGFGYGIANMRPLNTMSPDGKLLVFVPLLGDIRPLTMGIALPNAEHRTLTVQAFIDHCRRFVVEQGVFGTERIVK